ncbi:Glycosyl phosphatidyl inositol protein transamidase complex subunit [Lambiella insularis]|nr:Glycosyl phosphatidyl inositol protein transamidase complex subunit [Lambiella insularis]
MALICETSTDPNFLCSDSFSDSRLTAIEAPTILALRRDPRLLKLPPYLSAICIIVGVVWLFLLPLNDYSRQTYISENALLPGQVHTYFGGSEQNIFNAYKHEVRALAGRSQDEISGQIGEIFRSSGLKVARQKYEYQTAGNAYGGENIYSILHAPRGDATEAIVLVAAWRNMDDELNQSGVALVLTLARYFKRWSLWSKDIIFLITSESKAGPQAWVDAYHDAHSLQSVASLPLKSGALQGAIVVDNPLNHRFESLHITYDGINGQLPNLDLFNTAVSIASGQMGIGVSLQRMWKHDDTYKERLQTMLRGMVSQGLGHASGPHSSFIPYHVDAITLKAVGNGWQDEMAMGRCVESLFRSLNNLLEHLHQSFFFYLLMQANRFVSIGTYLPSAMLVAVNFTIMAIALWVQSGRPPKAKVGVTTKSESEEKTSEPEMMVVKQDGMTALIPKHDLAIIERQLFLPVVFILGLHFLGVVPLYIFNNTTQANLTNTLLLFTFLNLALPNLLAIPLAQYAPPTHQQRLLIKCFSLLLLGMFLATLATLNFSLAFLIGLLSSPLSFIGVPPSDPPGEETTLLPSSVKRVLSNVALHIFSPPVILFAMCYYSGVSVEEVLLQAAFGWNVSGLWTQVIVWCVWWPAWLVGALLVSPVM